MLGDAFIVLGDDFVAEEDAEEGMCGEFEKAMYGTRDAARNWEEEYTEFMRGIGLRRGMASPRVVNFGRK